MRTFIVAGIVDMHRTGANATIPLRPVMVAVAAFKARRDATENMLDLDY